MTPEDQIEKMYKGIPGRFDSEVCCNFTVGSDCGGLGSEMDALEQAGLGTKARLAFYCDTNSKLRKMVRCKFGKSHRPVDCAWD